MYYLLNDLKALNKFSLRTWCTKKLFGYRVLHTIIIRLDNRKVFSYTKFYIKMIYAVIT